jgi:signal transduction histidine kinase
MSRIRFPGPERRSYPPAPPSERRRAALKLARALAGAVVVAALGRYALPGSGRLGISSDTAFAVLALVIVACTVVVLAQQARGAAEAERARVVRDLHDGAQQRLVHAVISLKLARRALRSGGDTDALMAEALVHAEQAIRELRELAHGTMPGAVTRGGLRPGVEALVARLPLRVAVDIRVGRLGPTLESNAYFIVAEALTNVVKHAGATTAEVSARVHHGTLILDVRDDGIGGARVDGGPGLCGLRDRAESLGGQLRIHSPPERGTVVTVRLPALDRAARAASRSLASVV